MECPNVTYGLINPSPGYSFALVMTISFPILMLAFLFVFFWFRSSSVFLRKRSPFLLIMSYFGALVLWSVTGLYVVIGPERYPCSLYLLLMYFSLGVLTWPVLIKMVRYVNKVSIARIIEAQAYHHQALDDEESNKLQYQTANISMCESFGSYCKLVFNINRSSKTKLNAAKFSGSLWFPAFWQMIAFIPPLTMFIVRVATSPIVRNCYGCDLQLVDCSFLLGLCLFCTLISILLMPVRYIKKRDALHMLRECALVYWVAGPICILALILILTDPGNLYLKGLFDYRLILLMSAFIVIWLQTVHQVIVSKKLQHQLLTSPYMNKNELFLDVMNDRELNLRFRNFLHSELSSEIMLFLDAVDKFRNEFNTKRNELRNEEAKWIYIDFLFGRSSRYEVNVSHRVRDLVSVNVNKIEGDCEITAFDVAYDEVKAHLIADGFARFLGSLKASRHSALQAASYARTSSLFIRSFSSSVRYSDTGESLRGGSGLSQNY